MFEPRSGQEPIGSDLRPLRDALAVVRTRLFANSLLEHCFRYWGWSLGALLLCAVFLPVPTFFALAALLLVGGVVVSLAQTFLARPSAYQLAQQLDRAAGLQDRVATAVHLASAGPVTGVPGRQRRDALEYLAKEDAASLFPYRLPAPARTCGILVVALVAVLVYRGFGKPSKSRVDRPAQAWARARQTLAAELFNQRPPAIKNPEMTQHSAPLRDALDALLTSPSDNADTTKRPAAPAQDQAGNDPEGLEPEPNSPTAQLSTDPDLRLEQKNLTESSGREPEKENEPLNEVGKAEKSQPERESKALPVGQRIKAAFGELLAIMSNSPSQKSEHPADKPFSSPKSPQSGLASEGQSQKAGQQGSAGKPVNLAQAGTKNDQLGNNVVRVPGQSSQPGLQPGPDSPDDSNPVSGQRQDGNAAVSGLARQLVPLRPTKFKGEATLQVQIAPGQVSTREQRVMPGHQPVAEGTEQDAVPVQYRLYIQRYFDR